MIETLPLHTKYRPKTLDEIVGNKTTVNSLQLLISQDQGRPHAIAFYGPSGCGKTTLARIFAGGIGCHSRDFYEINAADARGIDTIRGIAEGCRFAPLSGEVKVYLLDECHRITADGANALLKLLEDTPSHVYFVLCTTEYRNLLNTIRTRVTPFEVFPLNRADMSKLINRVLEGEGVTFPSNIINELIRSANGSPRQALVLLGKVIDITDDNEVLQAIKEVTVNEADLIDFCKALIKPSGKKFTDWKSVLEEAAKDPENSRITIASYLSAVLLNTGDQHIADVLYLFSENMYYGGRAAFISACYLAYTSA